MVKIEVNNKTKLRITKKQIEQLLSQASSKDGLISLALVSSAEIKKLNKKYRKKDQVTDVLSFSEPKEFNLPDEPMGEIIICSIRARKQAKELGHGFQKEINRLTLHGFLHILGYDHKTEKQAQKMEKKEKSILKKFYGKI